MTSPCQVIRSRPVSVTVPMTVAVTSHLSQIPKNASTLAGSTTAIMRSCDSLMRTSSGVSVLSRSGARSSWTSMPPVPAAASSVVEQVRPAAPRSWMPTTRSAAKISRQHSMSTFSMKGSPTCTLGRLAGPSSSKVALASTEAPPMPSPPVRAPNRTTWLPGPGALASLISSARMHAHAQRVDQRVAQVAGVEDDLAADVRQAQAVAVAADAGDHAGQHPRGVGGVGRAEAQRVHDRRSGARPWSGCRGRCRRRRSPRPGRARRRTGGCATRP